MGFYDTLQVAQNKSKDNLTFTDNGAVVYSSIGSEMVDFSFAVNSLRNKSEQEICERIKKAYAESPEMATRMMFQIGDIREGKGERHIFNSCMQFMANEHPEIMKELMKHIPEYTRWDYAIQLATHKNPEIASAARKMVVAQIREDQKNLADGKSISLCAKWMPSIQSKKEEDRKLALKLEKALKVDHKEYRKLLSQLREKLNIIERKQSLKEEITREDMSNMSSKALLKYSAGMSENKEFQEFMQDVAEGKETINAGVLTPSDVVHKYTDGDGWGRDEVKDYDLALENMWNNLKDNVKDKAESTIVVRDGSGSMTCPVSGKSKMSCLEVATALSIYCAERMPGDLKDKFITFSSRPELVNMSHLDNLHDKLELCYEHNDCTNTDLKKTFDLLLNTLKRGNISQEEAPKNILILSDMQFDSCHTMARYGYGSRGQEQLKPLFDTIREEWADAGYKLPTLVFWQLNVAKSQYPEVDNELGIVYVSGYNTENLDLVLSGELAKYTPEKQLEIILSNERYDAISEAFQVGLRREQGLPVRVNDRADVVDMPTGYEQQEIQRNNRDEQSL